MTCEFVHREGVQPGRSTYLVQCPQTHRQPCTAPLSPLTVLIFHTLDREMLFFLQFLAVTSSKLLLLSVSLSLALRTATKASKQTKRAVAVCMCVKDYLTRQLSLLYGAQSLYNDSCIYIFCLRLIMILAYNPHNIPYPFPVL